MIRVYSISACFLILLGAKLSECCTFPTDLQNGTWFSNDMGSLTFNSSHFTASAVFDFGAVTFACQTNSGNKYYILSETFNYLSNDFKVAICINLYQHSSSLFYYFPLTSVLSNTNISRLILQANTYSFTESETCALSTQDFSQLRVLVQNGTINESATACSNNMLGNYQYSNVSGSTCLENETSLVTCDDQKTLTFNLTSCSTPMLFSAGGVLSCVFYSSSSGVEYNLVYNHDASPDESTYYRFTCVAASVSDGVTYISTYPQACPQEMNSTYTLSAGISYTMTASTTCAISASESSASTLSAGGAVAVSLALIVIIAAVVVIALWYYFWIHRKKKIKPDTDSDVLPSRTPPVDTKEQKKMDGRVSPFSPYPTVSELAVYRFGPSPANEIDDDDGGMTLEATTPGFTEGRRTFIDKDAERESQVSLPMYSEVGGETPEPTRLSEVNTRMSEVSQDNIADPTPWTMTRATMNIPEETSVSPIQSEAGKAQTPREANDVTL